MDTLPLELEVDILSRLPLKQVLRLKSVSKWWNAEISSSGFRNLYQQCRRGLDVLVSVIFLNDSSVFTLDLHENILTKLTHQPPTPSKAARFSCSSNGFLFFLERTQNLSTCVLYNPLTADCVRLPPLSIDYPYPHIIICPEVHTGCGYSSESDDYKILKLFQFELPSAKILQLDLLEIPKPLQRRCLEVAYFFSMKMKSWKKLPRFPPCDDVFSNYKVTSRFPFAMAYCNNSLHWISRDAYHPDPPNLIISAFNLDTEKYYMLPQPDDSKHSSYNYYPHNMYLVTLKGYLHLVCNEMFDYTIRIMTDYGKSWTKIFHCPILQLNKEFGRFDYLWRILPYVYSEDGQDILIGVETISKYDPENPQPVFGGYVAKCFASCNLPSLQFRKVEITVAGFSGDHQVHQWVPSLAYPDNLLFNSFVSL